jgi:hypothetical protein
MKKAILSALLLGAAVFAASPSDARPADHPHVSFHGHAGIRPHAHFAFRNHDFRHFTAGERHAWTGGRWRHMWWHGHYGWWWGVGGSLYLYPTAIYPFPDEVSSTYYDEDDGGYDDQNGGGYDDQAGPGDQGGGYDDQAGPGDQGGGGYGTWYHCRSPDGYYPYVKTCKGGWEEEPAQPSDMQGGPNDRGPQGRYDDQGQPPPPRNR